ncbi:conserved hypothetical protein [Gammaproteobacteria bacterium]
MKKRIVISDVEAVSPFGNDINSIFNNLIIEKKHLQTGKFNHISDFNFYDYHYDVKTRIDICSQLCIHTTAQLLKEKSMYGNDLIGLITASKNGCPISKSKYLEQLKTFEEPQYASPKDFVQSICNIPNSQATIECGIKGITNHYVGASDASLTGLWQAVKCIRDGMANEMVVSAFDVITDTVEQKKRFPSEGVFQDIKYSEAAASVKVQLGEDVNQNNVLFEVLGIGLGVGPETDIAVGIALSNAIKESNINEKDVSFIISNSSSPSEFYKKESRGVVSIFNRPVPTFLMKSYTGECHAPFPLLSMAMLSRMSSYCLPSNLFAVSDMVDSKHLVYENIMIEKGSIALIIGYGDFANAVVICLKHGK